MPGHAARLDDRRCRTATASCATSPAAGWPRCGRPRICCSAASSRSRCSARSTPPIRRARARFQREARTAAQVSDQTNVVTIYDIGEHDDDAFIVMEHFAGGTVADRLRAARDAGERVPRDDRAALAARGRGRPRRRARGRDRPSRRQAREPPARRARPPRRRRLRHRPAGRRHADDADRPGARDRRLHLARAGARPAGDRRRATATRWRSSPTSC